MKIIQPPPSILTKIFEKKIIEKLKDKDDKNIAEKIVLKTLEWRNKYIVY